MPEERLLPNGVCGATDGDLGGLEAWRHGSVEAPTPDEVEALAIPSISVMPWLRLGAQWSWQLCHHRSTTRPVSTLAGLENRNRLGDTSGSSLNTVLPRIPLEEPGVLDLPSSSVLTEPLPMPQTQQPAASPDSSPVAAGPTQQTAK